MISKGKLSPHATPYPQFHLPYLQPCQWFRKCISGSGELQVFYGEIPVAYLAHCRNLRVLPYAKPFPSGGSHTQTGGDRNLDPE